MRRVPLVLVMLLALTAIAAIPHASSAQTTVTLFGPAVSPVVNPDIVIARLMTFDRDNDGRLVKSELPERMQNLLAADSSGDQALDREEIRAMARPAPPAVMREGAATVPGLRGGGGGGYTFGDQISLSTRSHVEGALEDLRLSPSAHQQALAIVRPFMDALEADAEAVLLKELQDVINTPQLSIFKSMIDRQLSSGSGVPVMVRPDGTKVTVFGFGPDPTMIINSFRLAPDRNKRALDALDGFKARIRPGEADRAVLINALKNVLSDEERENFDAALQRRPLVKAGGVMAGVVGGFTPAMPPPVQLRAFPGDVVRPDVLRPRVLEP